MVSLDEVFELFTKERRRLALYYLDQRDGKVPVPELAEQISEWERDESRRPPADDRFRDVVISLRHEDLPKAAEAEFVEYDPEESAIELTGGPPEFEIVLSVAEAIEGSDDDGISSLL